MKEMLEEKNDANVSVSVSPNIAFRSDMLILTMSRALNTLQGTRGP